MTYPFFPPTSRDIIKFRCVSYSLRHLHIKNTSVFLIFMFWRVLFENKSNSICLWGIIDILSINFRFARGVWWVCVNIFRSPDRCLNCNPPFGLPKWVVQLKIPSHIKTKCPVIPSSILYQLGSDLSYVTSCFCFVFILMSFASWIK